ncbi:MAG TPA: hypothetical protein VFS21_01365 [Roseiflexaceae bacterium]|nr:hypothetical protein [Roseiflexaceae bacterium]
MNGTPPFRLPPRPQRLGLGSVPPARLAVLFGLVLLVLLAFVPALIHPGRAATLTELERTAVRRTLEQPRDWDQATERLAGFYRGELAATEGGRKLTLLLGGLLAALTVGVAVAGQQAQMAPQAAQSDQPLRLAGAGPVRARAALQPATGKDGAP